MRKKILSFVLMISIFSSLFTTFPIVANAAEMPVSINSVYSYYEEGMVKAAVSFDLVNEDGTAFLAVYDEGKLVNIGQAEFKKDKKAKMVKIEGVDESYIGLEAKIFCWGRENSLIPLSTPFTVQITDYFSELIRRLNAVSDEIDIYTTTDRNNPISRIFTVQEKRILSDINVCIDDALANHADELTAGFIKENYKTQIANVQAIYNDLVASSKDGTFKKKLATNFTVDNLIWLTDTLGIDVSDYGINTDDYI